MKPKPFSFVRTAGIAGLILGELYMVFTVGSPRLKGVDVPWTSILIRMLAASPFFGAFGLAAGSGVGLILQALFGSALQRNPSSSHPPLADSPSASAAPATPPPLNSPPNS